MATGQISTYDLDAGTMLDFEDRIDLLDPTETPVQNGYMGDGSGAVIPSALRDTTKQVKVEWQDEELLLPRSVLDGGIDDGTSDLALDVAAGTGIRFGVGDVLRLEDEYVRVTAVATDTLTITRGYGASAGAAHADGTAVTGVGKALPEGSDPETARALNRTERFNVTQIFGPEAVETSGTKDAIRQYGVPGTEHDKQVFNRFAEQAVAFEQAIFYGQLFNDVGNETRTMGGVVNFVQTNVDSSTTTLDAASISALVGDVWDAGGNPGIIEVGFAQKANISAFDSNLVRYVAGEAAAKARGQIVDAVDIDGVGRILVGLNRWVLPNDLFLRSREQLELVTLRPWFYKSLGDTGDGRKGIVVGEKTLKFHKERHAGRMSTLTP